MGSAKRGAHYLLERLDAVGILVAFVYGLPTLGYGFGRDQSIFCYVGREWTKGRLPYAEAFDIKPPGIYAVYAVAGKLFGFQPWSIRLLELFAVLLLGVCVAYAVRRDQPPARGEIGAMTLLTSGFYFTVFDYWDTGQVEFWESLFVLGGYLAAERVRDPWRAAVMSGLLGGTAVMFKTPVVLLLPVAGCVVVARAYLQTEATRMVRVRKAAIAFVLHCIAGVAVAALVMSYFAWRGGWPALVELAGYTATYVRNTKTPDGDVTVALDFVWGTIGKSWAIMLIAFATAGMALAVHRRAFRVVGGALIAAVLMVASACSVAIQLKFWSYHWVICVPFLLLWAAYGVAELARLRPRAVLPVALLAVLIGYRTTPHWATTENVSYRSYTQSFWAYVRGDIRRTEFLRQFVGPFDYDYLLQEQVGDAIGALARPGDELHVRGFEPAIYIHARLASPSRFASEAPISAPTLTYNRDKWLIEHDTVLWSRRPRFFVTFVDAGYDIANIAAHGYHESGRLGRFVWLERNPPPPPPPPPPPQPPPPPPAPPALPPPPPEAQAPAALQPPAADPSAPRPVRRARPAS